MLARMSTAPRFTTAAPVGRPVMVRASGSPLERAVVAVAHAHRMADMDDASARIAAQHDAAAHLVLTRVRRTER